MLDGTVPDVPPDFPQTVHGRGAAGRHGGEEAGVADGTGRPHQQLHQQAVAHQRRAEPESGGGEHGEGQRRGTPEGVLHQDDALAEEEAG